MARGEPPEPPELLITAHHRGLYAWLSRREEAAAAAGGTVVEVDTGGRYDGRDDRLAAVRAGEPISLRSHALPKWARAALGGAPVMSLGWRALVYRDDRVEFRPETAREWLDDHGL